MLNSHLDIDKHLSKLSKAKPLEDYCTNCGACCSPKVTVTNQLHKANFLVKDLFCKHVLWKSGQSKCSIYSKRHQEAPWCVDTQTMIKGGAAPADCPYVENLDGYTPAVVLNDPDYLMVKSALKLGIMEGDISPFNFFDLRNFLLR